MGRHRAGGRVRVPAAAAADDARCRPSAGQPEETVTEVTLAADGDQTILVVEERGLPLDLLAAYGAGVQIHFENIAELIAGRELRDSESRWGELLPAYEAMAAKVNQE